MRKNYPYCPLSRISGAVLSLLLLMVFPAGVKAQISLNPPVLSWEAGETEAKVVRVTSSGAWTADSTVYEGVFRLSHSAGPAGTTDLTVTPLSANTQTSSRDATVFLYTSSGRHAELYLVQSGIVPSLAVSPQSLTWEAGSTELRSVRVSSNVPWTVSVSGTGFIVSPSSGTGSGTVTASPPSSNSSVRAKDAYLTVSEVSGGLSAAVALTQSGIEAFPSQTEDVNYIRTTTFTSCDGTSWIHDTDWYGGTGLLIQKEHQDASTSGGSIVTHGKVMCIFQKRHDCTL